LLPQVRGRRSARTLARHIKKGNWLVWIEGLRIEGECFTPKLNVLVGGRGTGKSSVIELIRFCLWAPPSTEASGKQSLEHALGVLGDGRVTVTLTDGSQRLEVSRTAQDSEQDPSISFPAPYVFSQSEIETIGLQAQSRRRLVDGFVRSRLAQKSEEPALAAKVRSTTAEIRTLLAEMDDIADKTAGLPKLQEQLEVAKAQGAAQTKVHKEIEVNRKALAELTPSVAAARLRSETVARVAERLADWSSQLEELLDRKPTIEPWPTQAGAPDEFAELRGKDSRATNQLRSALEEIRGISAEIDRKKSTSSSQRTGLENRAREIRQKIEETQKGASALDKRISDLTQQISVLKSLIDLRQERAARVKHLSGNVQSCWNSLVNCGRAGPTSVNRLHMS
jgi:DNA repair exonuclease SbcCD ATPase subunit